MTFEDMDLEELEVETPTAVNGTGEIDLEKLEAAMSDYEERPTILKILHSTDPDHLRMLSEIPRRMVPDLVNADVLIAQRKRLVMHLIDKARRLQEREQASILELEATGTRRQKKVILPTILKSEQYLQIAQVHLKKLQGQTTIIETWVRSFLLYMRGVDRRGISEVLEAYVAAASDDDGEELDGDL